MNVIITGATGMVGEGVLHECLRSPAVEKVLVIHRRPCRITHPKLEEIIHADFFDLSAIAQSLGGYQACFFCLGVSSVGLSEKSYHHFTYDLTSSFASTVLKHNRDMTFCYVSGTGTDSSEKGRSMWARVKGKTENDLFKLPFRDVYAFRPGIIIPTPGLKNTLKLYRYMGWLIPVLRLVAPSSLCSLRDIGQAMIKAATKGYEKKVLEIRDIVALADR